MKSPKLSLPTLPTTSQRTPNFAKQVATLAAQPPGCMRKSSVTKISPAAGTRGSSGTKRSATRMPAQTASGLARPSSVETMDQLELLHRVRDAHYLEAQ